MGFASSRLRSIGLILTAIVSSITLAILVVAFVSTVFFGPAATNVFSGLLLTIALIAWTQCCYLLFVWMVWSSESRIRTTISSIGSIAVAGCTAIVLMDAFLIRPDPQSALILLFLPVLQWIAFAITLMAVTVANRWETSDVARTRWMILKMRLSWLPLFLTVVFAGWWLAQRPSNERQWVPNLARLPQCSFDENTVTIRDIRKTEYRSADDYTPHYYDRTFDLRRIESVDFIVAPFESLKVAAHTFLIFGFESGERVAISIEVRRERGETYSPLRGLLRQCELMYVIADERDAILLRTKHRRERVYLYPIRATKKKVRLLFVSMLQRANELRFHPEFYNTFTNNCTTNILKHYNDANERILPANLKVLFPGYADRLVYDLGIVDSELPFETLKRRSEITEKANRFADDEDFSKRIRE